nr:3-dehydroquinate synthase [Synechococcus sp. PCC 7502]
MTTTTITVDFPNKQTQGYEIAIAAGSLEGLGEKLINLGLGKKSKKVLIVSNPVIFKHYGDRTVNSLASEGFEVASLILPAGERFKTAASLQKIYDAALHNKLERSSIIVALGGGVIGDMAGYAAATWLRGLDFVQVPTTLLAMVDSAIGGKTGINHPQGKNLIGAFHQPRLVWTDPEVLKTLPAREFRAAMAEVIKYGVIWDRELFEQLSACQRLDQIRYLQPETLYLILVHCAKAKAEIVSKDEKEGNLRAILNYGHTVGHAIEMVTNYRKFNHGEAVGLGMVIAGAIAVELGFWQQSDQEAQLELIYKAKLPTKLPQDIDPKQIIAAMSQDKKVDRGKVIFIMPKAIGSAIVTDQVDLDTVYKVLQI